MPVIATVDNIMRNVETINNNIDGVWRESYPADICTIKIYQYGSLYKTIYCEKGESLTLPSYGIGYSTSPTGTVVNYGGGQTFSPTSNLNLYIIYSYTIGLVKYKSFYKGLTAYSTSTTATFTLPDCTPDDGETFYGWTKTSGSTTRNYTAGQTITSGNTTLYAIFSYIETTTTTATKHYVTHASQGMGSIPESNLLPVTVDIGGTISWTAQFTNVGNSYSGGVPSTINNSVDATLNTVGTNGEYIKILVNGTALSGTGSGTYTVEVGDTISATGTVSTNYQTGNTYSGSSYYRYPKASVTYPVVSSSTTKYRSTK